MIFLFSWVILRVPVVHFRGCIFTTISNRGNDEGPRPWDHVSDDKNPGCLGYIGDEILPSYIGIIIFPIIRIPIKQPVFHGK